RKPRGSTTSGNDALSPYLVSKSAVIQWTHLLALRLAPYDINVNCVCPGTIWTPLWERLAMNSAHTQALRSGVEKSPREVFDETARARSPLGRAQTPEEIGYTVAFLASGDADAITGQALNVNGGAIMN
ncbi:MAG: SDR family NAD(P)-dependent oxidoreductase, partial [Chloroflexota bacterium]